MRQRQDITDLLLRAFLLFFIFLEAAKRLSEHRLQTGDGNRGKKNSLYINTVGHQVRDCAKIYLTAIHSFNNSCAYRPPGLVPRQMFGLTEF